MNGYEARLSALEQIIIIIILGGGRIPGPRPPGDPMATDIARLDSLAQIIGRVPRGDPPPSDITRLSAVELEASLLQVSAEVTRLRSLEGEMSARLKEMRGRSK